MIRVFLIIALLLAPAAAAQEDLSLADDVEVTCVVVDITMGAVEQAIAGHYVLAFEKPQLPEGRHRMRIRLKNHKGVVYHREYYND